MAQSLPHANKFLVAILFTDTSEEVATVSENWKVDQDVMCYPNFKGPKMEKALRSHQTPDASWLRFPYTLLKVCGNLSCFLRVRLLAIVTVSNVNQLYLLSSLILIRHLLHIISYIRLMH